MTTEQLQMLLNTMQNLSVTGKEVFIWWLLLDKGMSMLGWLITFAGLCWLALKVLGAITAQSWMAKLRDEMGIGSPGPLWSRDAMEVIAKVRELMKYERK